MNKEHRIERDRKRVRKVRPVRQSRCFRSIAQFGTLQQWQQLGLRREMRERERSVGTREHKAKEERARCGVETRWALTERAKGGKKLNSAASVWCNQLFGSLAPASENVPNCLLLFLLARLLNLLFTPDLTDSLLRLSLTYSLAHWLGLLCLSPFSF
jgi:hypothetical protein